MPREGDVAAARRDPARGLTLPALRPVVGAAAPQHCLSPAASPASPPPCSVGSWRGGPQPPPRGGMDAVCVWRRPPRDGSPEPRSVVLPEVRPRMARPGGRAQPFKAHLGAGSSARTTDRPSSPSRRAAAVSRVRNTRRRRRNNARGEVEGWGGSAASPLRRRSPRQRTRPISVQFGCGFSREECIARAALRERHLRGFGGVSSAAWPSIRVHRKRARALLPAPSPTWSCAGPRHTG
jgi:hypothetical protein